MPGGAREVVIRDQVLRSDDKPRSLVTPRIHRRAMRRLPILRNEKILATRAVIATQTVRAMQSLAHEPQYLRPTTRPAGESPLPFLPRWERTPTSGSTQGRDTLPTPGQSSMQRKQGRSSIQPPATYRPTGGVVPPDRGWTSPRILTRDHDQRRARAEARRRG
jgi:hypothetical protein